MSRTHRLISTLAVVTALMSGAAVSGCGTDETRRSSSAPDAGAAAADDSKFVTRVAGEIAPRVSAGEVLLVDVREDAEWDAGRAPRAVHVPLSEVAASLDALEARAKGRPIAFICRSGNRSAQAAQAAVDGGLDRIINIDGGMSAWVAAGLPLTPDDGTVL